MTYFAEAKENYRFAPSIPGRLVSHTLTTFARDLRVEEGEESALLRCQQSIGMIVGFLDQKSLYAFHSTSKVIQHCLDQIKACPAFIIYEPDKSFAITAYSFSLILQPVRHKRVLSLDLSGCSKSIELFILCLPLVKDLQELNLSKPPEPPMPVITGYLLVDNEYCDRRSDQEVLHQDQVGGVAGHRLLASLRSLSSLKKLTLNNQFYTHNYRLRDIFRRELKGVEVYL